VLKKMKLLFHVTALCFSMVSAQTGPTQVGDTHQVFVSPDATSDIKPETIGDTETYDITHQGASYMVVHFKSFDFPPSCFMDVTNGDGSQSSTLRGRGRQELKTFWARHVTGDVLKLKMTCRNGERGMFEVDEYAAGFPEDTEKKFEDDNGVLSICGTDDKRNAVCYQDSHPDLYEKGMAVARLLISGTGLCTGWLVHGSNLLMTNEHCISTQSAAQNTDYEFMRENGACSSTGCQNCAGDIHEGTALLAVNGPWDYALIQLDSTRNPGAMYGYLELDVRRPPEGELLFIPQHPGGQPKKFGIVDTFQNDGECKVEGYSPGCAPTDMRYTCDTEGGSSGSPVLSRTNNKVVALHHCGGACNGNLGAPIIDFYDDIKDFFGPPQPTASPTECDGKILEYEIVHDNYPQDITWELANSAGDIIEEGGSGTTEMFCLPPNDCYTFTINDSYGDGICCSYGEGSYTLTWDGSVIGGGNDFTSVDTTEFGNSCGGQTGSPTKSPTKPPTPSPTKNPTKSPTNSPIASPSDSGDGFVKISAFQAMQKSRSNGKLKPKLFFRVKNEDKDNVVNAAVGVSAHYIASGTASDMTQNISCVTNLQGRCHIKLKAYDQNEFSKLSVTVSSVDSDVGEYSPDNNKKSGGCPLFSSECPDYTVT